MEERSVKEEGVIWLSEEASLEGETVQEEEEGRWEEEDMEVGGRGGGRRGGAELRKEGEGAAIGGERGT